MKWKEVVVVDPAGRDLIPQLHDGRLCILQHGPIRNEPFFSSLLLWALARAGRR
jgi:hypothetical protein